MKKSFLALVLASEKGTGFRSEKNKLLHPLLGKPMLSLVLDAVLALGPERVYVLAGDKRDGLEKEAVAEQATSKVEFVYQTGQRTRASVLLSLQNTLKKAREKNLLVIRGDLPLVQPLNLKALLAFHQKQGNTLSIMSAEPDLHSGFSQLIPHEKNKIKVIHKKNVQLEIRKLKEVQAGVYVINVGDFLWALSRISTLGARTEGDILTAVVESMAASRKKINVFETPCSLDVLRINTRYELSRAIAALRERKIRQLAGSGVTVYDPSSTWIDLDVRIGKDTVIYPSAVIEGKTVVGKNCIVYPGAHLINTRVGNGVKVLSSTVIEGAIIEDRVQVGPFARIRPRTILRSGSRVGNFVEMKSTDFGKHSKAGHLTYLGDCKVKEDVNIGAGTITCNYDGIKKHKTLIEAGVFIGSGTELVAPVKIGKGAYVGAGSTITKDVSPEALAVARSKQVEKPGWAQRKKVKK